MTTPRSDDSLPPQSTPGIKKIGETVHRPTSDASPYIRDLLLHLETSDYPHAPRHLGLDEHGNDILSYIEGDVPQQWTTKEEGSLRSLVAAAMLIRKYHDCVASFPIPATGIWNLDIPSDIPREIIAHNDLAPYNCVYREGRPISLIDFDTAAPASRAWDLAYAAYRFVPLSSPKNLKSVQSLIEASQARRLNRFLTAYGLENRSGFLSLVRRRVVAIFEYTQNETAKQTANAQRIRHENHLEFYQSDLEYLDQTGPALQSAIEA